MSKGGADVLHNLCKSNDGVWCVSPAQKQTNLLAWPGYQAMAGKPAQRVQFLCEFVYALGL